MKATVVINPIAGRGRSRRLDACSALARESLARGGFDADIRITTGPADAQRFAAEALDDGHELVVAWGGDGTVNGVGAALTGSRVAMGVIPGGSGNGLARDLGLPLDAAAAFAVAATGRTRAIDVGELNGSLFFNVAGIGLDARIAGRMAAPGARRGLRGYVIATLSELASYRSGHYVVELPLDTHGSAIATRALFIAIANSRQYGNGAQIAPLAMLDDGLMDVVVVTPMSLFSMLSRIPAFFNGTLRADEKVLMHASASATITSDRDIPYHVDGEPRSAAPTLTLRTRPTALLVRVKA